MTETALMADIVLPATMFMEHDDLYQGGGHQYFQLGPKLIEPPGECRSNHEVVRATRRAPRRGASRLRHGAARDHRLDAAEFRLGHDRGPRAAGPHRRAAARSGRRTILDGFGYPDGKFRFKPDWTKVPNENDGADGPLGDMPALPGPLGRDRGGDRGASVPPRHEPGAPIPQLDLHRDADLARQGAPARGDDPSRSMRSGRASPTATGSSSRTSAARSSCAPASSRVCGAAS